MKQRLKDSELVAICESEIQAAEGIQGKDISVQRGKALDFYLGEMDDYLAVEEDRSSAVSRDVSDTVEWILPSLMRIFIDAENAVAFDPVGPEDEKLAEQETDTVHHIFYSKNEGFLNLYTFCKDALLQKTGIFKCWWEEPTWEREEYKGLTPDQVMSLVQAPGLQYEIIGYEEYLDEQQGPLVDITLKCARKAGKVCVETVPPEEFGISANANSPNPKKAQFLFHRRRMTAAELIADGYDRKLVESLPYEGDVDTEESLAKAEISGDMESSAAQHWSMRSVWVTECYLDVDRDGDGIAEKLRVVLATSRTGMGNAKLLDVDEVDSSYISAATPLIMTHRFYGQSVADLVMEIQEIRTSLLRGILDNTYLANNGRTAVNERVNLDDLLASRPGGIVRTEGFDSPANHMMPIGHTPIPQQTFGLLEVLDQILKQRTGVGDEVMGLDANALANVNTGVIAQAYDSARMRIEMIARILAEVGLKECFRDIHELARKHQDVPMVVKLRNEWVPVNPAEWKDRDDITVQVGIGNFAKERRMMSLADIGQVQQLIAQGGGMGTIVSPQNVYNLAVDRAEAQGLESSKYFTDPATIPPPPPQPDPNAIMMQFEQQKMAWEREKFQAEMQMKMAELEMRRQENEMSMRKMAIDEQSQVMNAQTNSASKTWEAQQRELQMMLDKYKAELQASTQLETKLMEIDQRQSEQMGKLFTELEQFRAGLMKDGLDRMERQQERDAGQE